MGYVTFLPEVLQWFPTALRINSNSLIRPVELSAPRPCPSPWCSLISLPIYFSFLPFLEPSKPIPASEPLHYYSLCSWLFLRLLAPSYLSLKSRFKYLLLRIFLSWSPYLKKLPALTFAPLSQSLSHHSTSFFVRHSPLVEVHYIFAISSH